MEAIGKSGPIMEVYDDRVWAHCSLYCLVLDSLWILLFKYEAQIPELFN